MFGSFLAGALAGYGIAVPVGAVAILLMQTAMQRGFTHAAAAGTGIASADGTYALIAAVFGTALAQLLASWADALHVLAAVALAAIAFVGLARVRSGGWDREVSAAEASSESPPGRSLSQEYATFLGLTLLNPMTITYFTALILGLSGTGVTVVEKALFVLGAFLASLSWQWALAAFGAVLHRQASPRARRLVTVVAYLLVLGFAVVLAAGTLS